VIDDVACKKSRSATKIEAAKIQYAGSEKDLVNCNVAVTSYYVDEIRDFPVNLEPYVPVDEFEEGEDSPDFFTKIERWFKNLPSYRILLLRRMLIN